MAIVTISDVLPVVSPADDVIGAPQGQWNYDTYAAIPDDGQRYEVIGGTLYMAPAPGGPHQYACSCLIIHLGNHVQLAGLGIVLTAPCDVRLGGGTVVQPDVLVLLNQHLDRFGIEGVDGPPDLVVEIASPSTATHDRSTKLRAYEASGVPEYWIADPFARTVEVMVLQEGAYRSRGVFQGNALLPSTIVPGLPVRVAQFFA